MDWKLIFSLACVSALALGACSGNNASSVTTGGDGEPGTDPADPDGEEEPARTPLEEARHLYGLAQAAVEQAQAAITAGDQDRTQKVADAKKALRAAVAAADAAVQAAEDGDAAARHAAAGAQELANSYLASQTRELDRALAEFVASLAWYNKRLIRHQFANGVAVMPNEGANEVEIARIPRTKDTSPTDSAQIPNPAAFTSTTFKTVPYADGKMAFVPSDDEFKVDGYTSVLASTVAPERFFQTGLKLKSDGLVIRTGGTSTFTAGTTATDYTDMRKDITKRTDDTDGDGVIENNVGGDDGEEGQNGWDLEITFDEPQTTRVAAGETSWMGNGDFYWRGIVPAARSQTATDGDYYQANAFRQTEGFKDLGTYEVWLSNHSGLDNNFEPVAGSGVVDCPENSGRGLSCPYDDEHHYLKYAAYGVFVYTSDVETFFEIVGGERNGQKGRMQSIHFGYSAFADETGKKTTDIGTAITSGRFRGQALAYGVKGDFGGLTDAALLRGDAVFTVSIPKTAGSGSIRGTLNNFEQWIDGAWTDFSMTVTLPSTTVNDNGTFDSGADPTVYAITATGRTDLNTERGNFKGAFYGPRSDSDDLEVAGSWTIGIAGGGSYSATEWSIMGSFGARQW